MGCFFLSAARLDRAFQPVLCLAMSNNMGFMESIAKLLWGLVQILLEKKEGCQSKL